MVTSVLLALRNSPILFCEAIEPVLSSTSTTSIFLEPNAEAERMPSVQAG